MEKQLPGNIEAEAAVLGSILIDSEALESIIDVVQPDDFGRRDAHRVIATVMWDLFAQGKPADLMMVIDTLRERDKLEEAGGASYVSSLDHIVPTSANVGYYADIVRGTAHRRRMIHTAGEIAGIAYNEPDAEAAQDEAERLILALGERGTRHTVQPLGKGLHDWLDVLNARMAARARGDTRLTGVPTGFRDLDRMTGGLQRSDLIILAARPSLGKSTLGLNIAEQAARAGTPALFLSLEMSREQLEGRLVAGATGIDLSRLRSGDLSDEEAELVTEHIGRLSELPLYLDDTPALTLAQVRALARRQQREHFVGLVVVDYLQLMQGGLLTDDPAKRNGSHRRPENRQQEVSEISRGLKALARELNLPILALCQLSRAVEARGDKKPQLSDLRESGSLEQDSDIVMFIHREDAVNPESERKNIADILIAKHRNGPVGTVSLYFQPELTRYRDLAMGHYGPGVNEAMNDAGWDRPGQSDRPPHSERREPWSDQHDDDE